MRFLFFSAQFLPTVGGVERYTYNLCKTLTDMGHECTVVTSALPSLPKRETMGKIKVIRLPSRLFMNGRFPVIKKNRSFRAVVGGIFEEPFDFAVIGTRFYLLSLFAARQCARQKIPAIVIEHGTKHLSQDCRVLDFFGNLYEHAAMRYIRRYCNRFFGVSKACENWLSHFGVTSEGVLYNAVDIKEICSAADSSGYDAREAFLINEDTALVVFSGRFIREKGILEALSAFESFRKNNPDISAALILAGEGPLFEQIKEQKREDVFIAGMLSYADNIALLKQADIFLLPTYSEGFSTVTLEAAALGRFIITTKTGGSPELIENMKSGILLEEASSTAVERALAAALSDEDFLRSAGGLVKSVAAKRFSWQSTAESLIDIVAKNNKEKMC